jgi:hypothetical protein
MFKAVFTVKSKCKRHPKFNPALHGAGAVIGNCGGCLRLLEQWQYLVGLINQVKAADIPVESRGLFG